MTKKTMYLLGILLIIILGAILYAKYCAKCSAGKAMEGSSARTEGPGRGGNFHHFGFTGDGIDYHTNNNFKFLSNGFNKLDPVGDSINNGIGLLKTQLENNPDQRVLITGYAAQGEKNASAYNNLGYARAVDVKNYFVSQGIPASRFEIKGVIVDSLNSSQDTVLGAVGYELFKADTAAEPGNWEALKDSINDKPLALHFETGQSQINLTAGQRQKITDIVRYLDNVPDAQLIVTGHTDNQGNRDTNIGLGQKRADFIKGYLVRNGIGAERIISSSKGPDEPIADNSTEEGRAENRRTVVTIK